MTEADQMDNAGGIRLIATLSAALAFLLGSVPAQAQTPTWTGAAPQYVQCPAPAQPLLQIPELISEGGVLRGTVLLNNRAQRMYLGAAQKPPGAGPDFSQCLVQEVRQLSGIAATPANYAGSAPPGYPNHVQPPSYPGYVPLPPNQLTDPVPGPTLRARIGDIVQLSFLNQIGNGPYWQTLDRGEKGQGCDRGFSGTSRGQKGLNYPGPDQFPDCFHGSTTGNLHFHGTHTNPGSSGDNIFLEVRPSLLDSSGAPVVTQASIKAPFDEFFANCKTQLDKDVLSQWPNVWSDLPVAWTGSQETLLKLYDENPTIVRKLWPANAAQLAVGAWPEFSIGATPYCFRLPAYTPPLGNQSAHPSAHAMAGAEQSRALVMGQAPGTHWYHAHKHGSTAIDVSNGVAGAFIVEGGYDDMLNEFYGPAVAGVPWARTQPVLVINQLGTSPNLFGGGNTTGGPLPFGVNGRFAPMISMQPGQVQLWRMVNASSRGGVQFVGFANAGLPPAAPPTQPSAAPLFMWKQTAQDGVQFRGTNYNGPDIPLFGIVKSGLMAAGNRADMLVKAPTAPGTYVLLAQQVRSRCEMLPVANVPEVPTGPFPESAPPSQTFPGTPVCGATPAPLPPPAPLLYITVTGPAATGNQAAFIPAAQLDANFPAFLADIPPAAVKGTKTVVFDSSAAPAGFPVMHTIDGHAFDGNVGEVVLLNTIEEWKIVNRTVNGAIKPPVAPGSKSAAVVTDPPGLVDHPFHIHINPFQVVEFFDPNEVIPATKTSKAMLKYVFVQGPPAVVKLPTGQCALDIDNPDSWKPCDAARKTNLIWWDVFAIPSARAVFLQPDGTGQVRIVPEPTKGSPAATPSAMVKVAGYFKMRSRFVDYTGQYVIHCHILAHEDRGMMTVVEVVPFKTPYSHN